MTAAKERLRVEVWADVICPFCWIGKRRLENAARRLGLEMELVHRAFELNPAARAPVPLPEYLAQRFGGAENARAAMERTTRLAAGEGLAFDMPRAIASPTFDAHRLVLHAQARGRGPEALERLMRAHFSEGLDLSDHATLVRLAGEVGLDPDEAARMLAGQDHAVQVREDELTARGMGIGGVPFFVFDGRLALSGAQPAEVFERALGMARRP